jgi:hypothetical protein
MSAPCETFRFDRVVRLGPQRERELAQFLGNPIDSRERWQVVGQVLPMAVPEGGRRAEVDIAKEWEKRFSRVCERANTRMRPRCSSIAGSTLIQRQTLTVPNALNQSKVEEIADRRAEIIQEPQQPPSHLPKLRRLPKGILNHPIKKSRHNQF